MSGDCGPLGDGYDGLIEISGLPKFSAKYIADSINDILNVFCALDDHGGSDFSDGASGKVSVLNHALRSTR